MHITYICSYNIVNKCISDGSRSEVQTVASGIEPTLVRINPRWSDYVHIKFYLL